jgi:hypothetical protein
MDRRIVASAAAVVAAVALFAGAAREVLASANLLSVDVALYGVWVLISVAIPVIGAVLIARRRPEGVAVLVTAALIAVPTVVSLGYILASPLPGPEGHGTTTALYFAAQVAMVAAGAVAWGLRDADRWRWDRPVLSPYVALSVVALLPTGASLVTMHGVFFPVAMLVGLNLIDLVILVQTLLVVALLVLAARLPRRTAAVVLLVLLAPRLYDSIAQVVRELTTFEMGREPLHWLGIAAEAALVGTACWWLTRGDPTPIGTDPERRDEIGSDPAPRGGPGTR